MTVAAVILAASVDSALAEVAGRPSVRRIVESAWAGGAVARGRIDSQPAEPEPSHGAFRPARIIGSPDTST